MLSFMREPGAGNSSEHPPTEAGARDVKVPDGADAQEYLTVATNSKDVRRSTIVVVILVAAGLLGLLFMIHKSRPQAAAAKQAREEQAKIEDAIGRLTGVSSEMVDRMDEIVNKFYQFSDVFQVKVDELVKDPFEVEGNMKPLQGKVIMAQDSQAQAGLMRQRLQQQAGTLKLLSVMRSSDGDSCMINDQILRQGDRIEDFTVAKIASNSVELAWSPAGAASQSESQSEETKIILKLSE